jgi:hypothetical protein
MALAIRDVSKMAKSGFYAEFLERIPGDQSR